MSFFESARRGDNAAFKYVLTIIAVILGAFVGQIPFGIALSVLAVREGMEPAALEEFQKTMDFSILGMDPNLGLFLILLSFVAALATLFLCIIHLHRKKPADVLTGRPRLDWGRVAFAFIFWLGLSAVQEVVSYAIHPEVYDLQFELSTFLPLLVIALLILPLQTTFEEALFRGYLMQGFGLLFGNRWLPLLLTSVGFGLLHFANQEVSQFGMGLMMTYYIGFGLLMGLCTLMDEGTELALGLHAATNIYAATIVSYAGSTLQTPAVFKIRELDVSMMLIVALGSGLFFLLVAARRYGWKDWGKLLRKIEPEGGGEEDDSASENEEMGPILPDDQA